MLPWITPGLAAFGVLAIASAATASPVTYTGYSVLNNENVLLTDAAAGFNEWAGSGQITLLGTNTRGGTLSVWCVDIPEMLQTAGQFVSTHTLTGPLAATINALLSNGIPLLGADVDRSSALQLAVWKAVYGDGLAEGPPGRNVELANSYLDLVDTGAWRANASMQVTVLSGGGQNQDQAYLTPVGEPASLVVLGAGLIGIGLTRRRINQSNILNRPRRKPGVSADSGLTTTFGSASAPVTL